MSIAGSLMDIGSYRYASYLSEDEGGKSMASGHTYGNTTLPSPIGSPGAGSRKGTEERDDTDFVPRDPAPLSWRLDPDESLSDWTLTVISKENIDEGEEDSFDTQSEMTPASPRSTPSMPPARTYFVHRTQLAIGPRRSDYFAKLFRNRRHSAESIEGMRRNGTRIELKPSAAAAFPAMLDFMYSPIGTPPDVTTESAVALRHLATCFGIRELFNAVTSFIKKDITLTTATTYLLEASTYKHEKLVDYTIRMCAEKFDSIKLTQIVLLPPNLLEQVVRSPHLRCSSEVLSTRVASYCRCRPNDINEAILKSITDAEIMPRVTPDESLYFINLLFNVGMQVPDSNSKSVRPTLYQRCVAACPDVVRGALEQSQSTRLPESSKRTESRQRRIACKDYIRLPNAVKVDLLETTLSKQPMAEFDDASTSVVDSIVSSVNHRDKRRTNDNEIRRIKKAYERKLESMQAKLAARDEEIRKYAAELAKFSRVPPQHRVSPLLSEYTYKERPEYDEYGESIYGFIPPTALPQNDEQESDGWIYREEKWDDTGGSNTKFWPMYFYKAD